MLCVVFFFFLRIRQPPRSTLDRSSAASDVYKRQITYKELMACFNWLSLSNCCQAFCRFWETDWLKETETKNTVQKTRIIFFIDLNINLSNLTNSYLCSEFWSMNNVNACLLYTSDAADERSSVDLGGRRIIKKKKNNK